MVFNTKRISRNPIESLVDCLGCRIARFKNIENMRDQILWKRIENFKIDRDNVDFNFTQRLARDNNWSLSFSGRVVEEYKKFIYLCCVGYGEITPSDEVDQAWHLHLTYTRSYWTDLCQETLKKELHHNPTKGGNRERIKFSDCYTLTFEAYHSEFGSHPPKDIWPDNSKRFRNINYQRLNVSNYWLIKKPVQLVRFAIMLSLIGAITLLFIQSKESFPWLGLFVMLMTIAFIIRGFRGGRGKGPGSGSDTGGFWTGFWGCSGDSGHSGCSSHGCSGGCSGCGGD